MAILSEVFGFFRREYPNENPARVQRSSVYDDFESLSGRTKAGVTITDDSATTITAVYRAVQLIASTIASLPLHVFEVQNDGSRKQVSYRADSYLWKKPNPEVSSIVFWETVIGHEVLNGNAYLFVVKNETGDPIELWPVEPRRVFVGRDPMGQKIYAIDGSVPMRDFVDGGEMVHVTGWGRNGLLGLSPIRQMGEALGLMKAAQQFASLLFSQGTTLGGVLSTDQTLTPEQARGLSDRWDAAHAGLARAHKTAVMANGLKWQQTAMNPVDAQLLDSQQFGVAEVGRMFGVPEFLLGAHDKQSSWGAGLEVNIRAFLTFTLAPHIIRFEQTVTDELLGGKRYVKFETGGLLRGTAAEQASYFERMQRIGVFSINDILKLLDREAIGEQGDIRLIPKNIGRLEDVGVESTPPSRVGAPPPADAPPAA